MRTSWCSGLCVLLMGAAVMADDPQPQVDVLIAAPPGAVNQQLQQLELRGVPGGNAGGTIVVEPTASVFAFFDSGEAAPSPHWIGLGCSTATDALRSQLGLTETGVVVHDVVADSPAQKAGFQLHDVLLKATVGERTVELKEADQIVQAVKDAQLKPIKIELLRKGKPLALEVTPAERPQPEHRITLTATHPKGVTIDPERVQQLLGEGKLDELKAYIAQQTKEHPPLGGMLRYHAAGPVMAPPNVPGFRYTAEPLNVTVTADASDDLTLTITKSGKQPAEIKAQKGEQSWTVSEKELDKLPDDVRSSVQSRLAQMNANAAQAGLKARLEANARRTIKGPATAATPQPLEVRSVPPTPARVSSMIWKEGLASDQERKALHEAQAAQQQQLQAVQKQLEELKQLVEKLANKP